MTRVQTGTALAALAMGAALLTSGCGARDGASVTTRSDPSTSVVRPATTVVTAAPTGPPPQPPPAPLPATLVAMPLGMTSGPGILTPGQAVPANTIGVRAGTGTTEYGLANYGSVFGMTYPAISTDGGTDWQIDGPRFAYAAAQGGSEATDMAVHGRLVYAWSYTGYSVRVTADGGRLWLMTDFPYGVPSVRWRAGVLVAAVYGPGTDSSLGPLRTYVSADEGRTWQLQPR